MTLNTILFAGNVAGPAAEQKAGNGSRVSIGIRAVMSEYQDRDGSMVTKKGTVQFETYEKSGMTPLGQLLRELRPGEYVVVAGHLEVIEYEKNGEPKSFTKHVVDKVVNRILPEEHRPDGSVANPGNSGGDESDIPF